MFIANIECGSVRYLELDTPTIDVMALGDSWLCAGELAGRAERDGVEKALRGRFLSAWTGEAGALNGGLANHPIVLTQLSGPLGMPRIHCPVFPIDSIS